MTLTPLHLNPRMLSVPRASDGRWYSDGRTEVGGDWQLAEGHYEKHFELQRIYPLDDATTETYERHRWAYPEVKYEIPIGVRGGAFPYRYQMTEGPSWLGIEKETLTKIDDVFVAEYGYGVLSGVAPESGGIGDRHEHEPLQPHAPPDCRG